MYTSPEEMLALQRVAELEPPLAALESCLGGLAQAVGHFSRAARDGGVPSPLRQRLALASGRVAAQREALARATAALDRAIDVLLPDHPLHGVYGAAGAPERHLRSGQLQA